MLKTEVRKKQKIFNQPMILKTFKIYWASMFKLCLHDSKKVIQGSIVLAENAKKIL